MSAATLQAILVLPLLHLLGAMTEEARVLHVLVAHLGHGLESALQVIARDVAHAEKLKSVFGCHVCLPAFQNCLFFKGHLNAHFSQFSAIIRHALGQIVLHLVTIKAYADTNARLSDDLLLCLVGKEVQKILVLAVAVDGVVADVHLPEDVLVGHALEVVQGIHTQPRDVTEQVGMRHAHNGGAAPLGVGEQVTPRDGGAVVQVLNETVIKEGNIRPVRQGEIGVLLALEGAEFNATQDIDAVGVLLLNEMDVVVVAAEGALVVVQPHVGGSAEDAVTGVADTVVVVGDAEGVQASRDGGLHDGFRGILAAEGIVGVGMKILKHSDYYLSSLHNISVSYSLRARLPHKFSTNPLHEQLMDT